MHSYTFKVFLPDVEPFHVLVRANLFVQAVKKLRKRYGKEVIYDSHRICPNICVIID